MGLRPVEVNPLQRAPASSLRYTSAVEEPAPAPTPAPGPAITLRQTDTAATQPDNLACAGLLLGGQTENIELRAAGPLGSVPLTFVVNTESVRAHVFFESALNEPNQSLWDAGTWTVRLNVTGFVGSNARIRSCYICRVDFVGVNKGRVASSTDLNVACSAGVKTWTMTGREIDGLRTDRVLIVVGMARLLGSPVTVEITPNRNISTPILTRAA